MDFIYRNPTSIAINVQRNLNIVVFVPLYNARFAKKMPIKMVAHAIFATSLTLDVYYALLK
jgi:hypothetical protein